MTLLFDYIFRLGRPEGHAELGVVTSWLLGTQKLRSKVAQNYRKSSSFTRSWEPNAGQSEGLRIS